MTGVVAAAGRDALIDVIGGEGVWPDRVPFVADAVLASSWLEGVLAAERERVAVAIEEYAKKRLDPERWRGDSYDHGVEEGCEQSASIARAAVSAPTGGGAL